MSFIAQAEMDHPPEAHFSVLGRIPMLDNKHVLEVGCGKGVWGYLLHVWKGGERAYMVALDIQPDAVRLCKRHRIYDEVIVSDIRFLPFRKKSFDIVLACEVLEHISKEEGQEFLARLDEICKERIVLTTPNGYIRVSETNTYQVHRSGWTACELRHHGYFLCGYGFRLGPTILRFSGKIAMTLNFIFTPLAYKVPEFACFLVATKIEQRR